MADADKPLIRRKRARKSNDELPETPDAVDIAMHALATGADQHGVARAVLEKHARLIDVQCKREREELANVRVQRITRWLILSAVAALLLAIVGGIYTAVGTEALVVEPFRVPGALSQAGLGGEVMATRVMDRIATMQEKTLSTRPPSTYSTNWGDDIKIAVPDTGATLGDLRHLLRNWFGNETRISGEVVQEDGGWTVTARVSGHPAIVAKGPALEPLVTKAAEGIFSQTQPYRYIIYLNYAGRSPEAMAAARELAMNGPKQERPWGLVALANSMGPPDYGDVETLDAHRDAAVGVPDFPMPVNNYASVLRNLGRWEEALPILRRAASLVGNGERISEEFRGQYVAAGDAKVDELLGAYGDAAPKNEAAAGQGTPVYGSQYESSAVDDRYFQHDIRAGDANLRRYGQMLGYSNNGNKPLAAFLPTGSGALWAAIVALSRVERAEALGDRSALASAVRENVPSLVHFVWGLPPEVARDQARTIWPIVAVSMAKAGFAREGAQLLAPLPTDCYPCLVARGQVAAQMGDRAGATRWFAQAKRLGPSFPFADEALGRMLLASRDIPAAQRAFQKAIAIEPRFADAHAGLGNSDAAAGDWPGAASAYADAARYAPRWGKLHLKWAAALWNSGRQGEARTKLDVASRMELSQADRLLLSHLQAIAAH
jgi:tetratricopeptide (TPR) repeat protein